MAELVIRIPKELESDISDSSIDWEAVALEAIRLKAFEFKLQRSAELRKIVVEAISSKSGLSEDQADEFAIMLGRNLKSDRYQELKNMGVF